MNEERGTRDDHRAEADPGSGPGTTDGSRAALAGGGDGVAPGTGAARDGGVAPGGAAPGGAAPGGAAPGDVLPGTDGRGPATGSPVGSGGARDSAPVQAGPAAQRRPKRPAGRSWWIELPILLAFALVLALLIKTFVVQAFFIPSSSMENTLEIGDKVLVNKMIYDFRPIHRGDIMVFNGEGSWDPVTPQATPPLVRLWNAISGLFGTAPGVHDYIKRVIGIPGDHVMCCDAKGRVTVNGVPLNEKSYLYPGNTPSTVDFNITVPPGRLWVMGDHRSVSYDSRGHQQDPGDGTIPEDRVVGRAFVVVAPVSRWGVLSIPATFQQRRLALGPAALPALPALSGAVAPAAPVGLGLTGAVPLTLLQLRLRRRLARSLRRGRPGPG